MNQYACDCTSGQSSLRNESHSERGCDMNSIHENDRYTRESRGSPSEGRKSAHSHNPVATRASAGGKSSRVIERLMAENDRFKRELALAAATAEEERQRSESARAALEFLRGQTENLRSIYETSQTAITRKDRKIHELRAELEAERKRRASAEADSQQKAEDMDDMRQECARSILAYKEQALAACNEYEALKFSMSRLETDYRKTTSNLRIDINDLWIHYEEEAQILERLQLLVSQMEIEHTRASHSHRQLQGKCQAYRDATDMASEGIKNEALKIQQEHLLLSSELREVLNKMKWVVNVARVLRPV